MKRKILLIFFLVTVLFPMCFFTVFADETNIKVYLDNEKLQFDVEPQIINERTMVPMRVIFEKLGATVDWDNDAKKVYAYNNSKMKGVSIVVGEHQMVDTNMNIISLDVPAMLVDERTLVPLRAVSEVFGCDVQWDEGNRAVKIFSEGFIDYSKATESQTTVEVATVNELLNNIGSNRRIVLTSDYYNLSDAQNISNYLVERQLNWDDTNLDGYVIKNIVNMTIEGNAEIVTDDKNADVLSFEKCGQITLSGLTVGHTTSYGEYGCEGAVTRFINCDSIYFDNCKLYGCGAVGICADSVTDLNVKNSKIYDCTYTGIWLTDGSNANVNKTEFFDSIHASGFVRIDESTINCTECDIYDIVCVDSGNFIYSLGGGERSVMNFTNCKFRDNEFKSITTDYSDSKIVFNNCLFLNNKGILSNSAVTYTDCSIVGRDETQMIYYPDGRSMSVLKSEVPKYKEAGWYESAKDTVVGEYSDNNIKIYSAFVGVNSAGGAQPNITWRNDSGKTIKYIYFNVTPYNAVGDIVSCEISGKNHAILEAVGPYEPFDINEDIEWGKFYYNGIPYYDVYKRPGAGYYFIFDTDGEYMLTENDYKHVFNFSSDWPVVWYNYSIDYMKITSIDIEYMDGTFETIHNPPILSELFKRAGI